MSQLIVDPIVKVRVRGNFPAGQVPEFVTLDADGDIVARRDAHSDVAVREPLDETVRIGAENQTLVTAPRQPMQVLAWDGIWPVPVARDVNNGHIVYARSDSIYTSCVGVLVGQLFDPAYPLEHQPIICLGGKHKMAKPHGLATGQWFVSSTVHAQWVQELPKPDYYSNVSMIVEDVDEITVHPYYASLTYQTWTDFNDDFNEDFGGMPEKIPNVPDVGEVPERREQVRAWFLEFLEEQQSGS